MGGARKSLMDGEFGGWQRESYEGTATKVPEKLLQQGQETDGSASSLF